VCGRYTLAASEEALLEAFDGAELTFEHEPRYNIAPGQRAPVVAQDGGGRRIGLLTWGFVPAGEDGRRGYINARAESVAVKRSFREAFARRRCLIPADGFYEWVRENGRKMPYWFYPDPGEVVSFAGIWTSGRRPDTESLHTFAIITTDANEEVRPVHDRMPAVIARSDRDRWLDRSTDVAGALRLLDPAPPGTFSARRVSTRVNRADQDDARLIEPVRRARKRPPEGG